MRAGKWVGVATAAVIVGGSVGGYVYLRANDPQRLAEKALDRGDLPAAQMELRNVIRKAPGDAAAHLRLAKLQMKLADPAAAEKEFRAAIALGGDRATILPDLGEALVAQSLFKETLRLIPASGPTPEIAGRDLLLRSAAQLALHDVDAARQTLATAKKLAPGRPEVTLIAARLAAFDNDFDKTDQLVDGVLKADPTQIDALLMKEQLLTAKNRRDEALDYANRAVAAAPWSAQARVDRANLLLYKGRDADAQQDVDAVLGVQPRFADAIFLNGVLLARHGKYADAALELGKLDNAVQRFPATLYYQAMIANRLGQTAQAVDLAARYNTLVPKDPDGRRLLAETELATGRAAKALTVLRQGTQAGPLDAATLDVVGRAEMELGRPADALKAFSRAAELAPSDGTIMAHIGMAQMAVGDSAAAAQSLGKATELVPQLTTAGEALVSADLAAGKLAEAQAELAKLRARVGETEEVGLLTGDLKARSNDLAGAQAAYTATLKAFPASTRARLALARVTLQQGNTAAGLLMLHDMLAKDPTDLQVLDVYLPALLADNKLASALQALQSAHATAPQNDVLTSMLADTMTFAHQAPQAEAMLLERRKSGTMPALLRAPLARAQTAAGHLADARATYEEILASNPGDLVSRSALVSLLIRADQPGPAMDSLRQALKLAPGNYRVMSTLVALAAKTNGVDAGLKEAADLRQVPANMPAAALLQGDLLMFSKRPADAAKAYQAEFDAHPDPLLLMRTVAAYDDAGDDAPAVKLLQAWIAGHPDMVQMSSALAKLDIKAMRYDEAEAQLQRVLAKAPNNADALNNLAWVYHLTGDKRARETAQRAYLAAPTPDAGDTLGWIMTQEGAAKAAVPLLQQASAQRPDDPTMRYHLAAALNADGQAEQAAKLLQPLVAGKVSFAEESDARKLLDTIDHR